MERYGDSYRTEIEVFLDCARNGRDMPVNAIDGLRAAILAEAATISNQRGEVVYLTGIDQEFGNA